MHETDICEVKQSAAALIREAKASGIRHQASGIALRLLGGSVKAMGLRHAVASRLALLRELPKALASALQLGAV